MIWTFTGANSFQLQQELAAHIARFVAEHDPMGLERLDGEEVEYDRLAEAVTSLPFLASKKLVVIRVASANKKFVEQTADLLATVPETTDVILVEPKLDKRSGYYKYLKKNTEYKEFPELDVNGLARWLVQRAQAEGLGLSAADARFLVDRVGPNQQLLAHELDKLLLYEPTAQAVSRQTITLLTEPAPQSTVFELLEAAFAGNLQRTVQLYQEQRALKVEPQQIIAMLAWQLHVLALVKTAGGRSADEIAREAKVSPYVAKKTASIARGISLTELRQLVANLLTIDSRLKRESLDADELLQTYLVKLAAGQ